MRRIALGAVVLAACGRAAPPAKAGSAESAPPAAMFAAYDAGARPGGPGAGERFGLGTNATRTEVARWDTDIGPDGAELPVGHGSAKDGAAIFAAKCSACHGKSGEGMPPAFPALIGRDPKAEGFHFADDFKLVRTIGNYWPHATTVFDYVRRAMPLTAPGSLTDDEVYSLTAHLLAANGIIPDTGVFDAAALRRVKMPYVDKFVPDTRRGGPEVK